MNAPILSTVTLFTEIIVTLFVITVFSKSIKTGKFPAKLAFGTLAYEILFNISYMAFRASNRITHEGPFTWRTALGITHGILSLVMFLALIWFFIAAFNAYKINHNYFKEHKILTTLFLTFWLISVLSGAILYIAVYVIR